MEDDLNYWMKFRGRQGRCRSSQARFNRYLKHLNHIRERYQIPWDIKLELEAEKQTKFDEWKEFYLWHFTRIDGYESRLKASLNRAEAEKQKIADEFQRPFESVYEEITRSEGEFAGRSGKLYERTRELSAYLAAVKSYNSLRHDRDRGVKELSERLEWIKEQFPLIKAEGTAHEQQNESHSDSIDQAEPDAVLLSYHYTFKALQPKDQTNADQSRSLQRPLVPETINSIKVKSVSKERLPLRTLEGKELQQKVPQSEHGAHRKDKQISEQASKSSTTFLRPMHNSKVHKKGRKQRSASTAPGL